MNTTYEHKSRRLADWDYSWNGFYFITFCTADRIPYLGFIERSQSEAEVRATFRPSRLGEACIEVIEEMETQSDELHIDSYVVMPNHVHLLVFIQRDDVGETFKRDKRTQSIQRLVARVKSLVLQKSRKELGTNRLWQKSFHDHIVRSEEELTRIREYIANNPLKWSLDRFYREW